MNGPRKASAIMGALVLAALAVSLLAPHLRPTQGLQVALIAIMAAGAIYSFVSFVARSKRESLERRLYREIEEELYRQKMEAREDLTSAPHDAGQEQETLPTGTNTTQTNSPSPT